jgi:putative endonuclease
VAKHTEIGTKGEQEAVKFLKNKGYLIIAINWRDGHKEIDIVAAYANNIVFVEVKSRSSFRMGFPEEAVTASKKMKLKTAATAYMEATSSEQAMRFDIISILFKGPDVAELLHLEDAFW